MSSSKKQREETKRKRELFRPLERSPRGDASFVKPDIHGEVRHITQLAQAEDAHLVTLGNLVFFSTHTHDAWLLDREDGFGERNCQ